MRFARETSDFHHIWLNDLVAFGRSRLVESPLLFLTVHWDLVRATWHHDSPFVGKEIDAVKGTVLYFAAGDVLIPEVRISDVIFNTLPEKAKFRTLYVDDDQPFSTEPFLESDGHVDWIEFRVPKSLLTRREDLLGFIGQIELALKPDEAAMPGWFVGSASMLTAAARRVANTGAFLTGRDGSFDEAGIENACKDVQQTFSTLAVFTGAPAWNLSEGQLESLIKALVLGSLTGAPEIWHIPSREYIERFRDSKETEARGLEIEGTAGGLIVFLKEQNSEIDIDSLMDCLNLRNRALYVYQHKRKALAEATRAAEAAIISRNMSHNLGSHSLAKLDSNMLVDNASGAAAFLGYVQRRMDFVARVATDWPLTRQPMFFFRDVAAGFCRQAVLQDKLLFDDGYEGNAVHFRFRSNLRWRSDGAPNSEPLKFGTEGELPDDDPLVAIPSGVVGTQAFYAFLENAMRNAARHNPYSSAGVTVYLSIEERDNDSYELTYADSLSVDADGAIQKKLNAIAAVALVDESTGKITKQHWGCQEMKVCARFLTYAGTPESRWRESLEIADSLAVEESGVSTQLLGFKLLLQKAVLVTVADFTLRDESTAHCPETERLLLNLGVRIRRVDATRRDSLAAKLPRRDPKTVARVTLYQAASRILAKRDGVG